MSNPKKSPPIKTSAKLNAQYLAQLLKKHNCRHVVIAPGSRNAPLIIALTNDPEYKCISVIDERAAAFTALGLTISDKQPVAVVCSSGSAVANFYPAVAEAFYQGLPLVAITADRPLELTDQRVGQTIRQHRFFDQHIRKSISLVREPGDDLAKSNNVRLINEALEATWQGPVHINVPFDEPLYETVSSYDESFPVRKIECHRGRPRFSETYLQRLADMWNGCDKVMMVVGQKGPDHDFDDSINQLNEVSAFLALSESTSNLDANNFICSIDRLINTIDEEQKDDLQPELLITVGGELVSKMIKKYFRQKPPKYHWHIGLEPDLVDTFGSLTHRLNVDGTGFLKDLLPYVESKSSTYRDSWIKKDRKRSALHERYLLNCGFSDLVAFARVLDGIPEKSIVHSANSTSVRYLQLFDHRMNILHYANRGTSGIDGCTSTAIGHAINTDRMVTLITGDVAFLYDSNAFANDGLPANLRVVVVNNGGGNIFRIIEGPEKDERFERFQETTHQLNLRGIAEVYGLEFKSVGSEEELATALQGFYAESEKPKILEVKTPRLESPEVLKEYFSFLKNEAIPKD